MIHAFVVVEKNTKSAVLHNFMKSAEIKWLSVSEEDRTKILN